MPWSLEETVSNLQGMINVGRNTGYIPGETGCVSDQWPWARIVAHCGEALAGRFRVSPLPPSFWLPSVVQKTVLTEPRCRKALWLQDNRPFSVDTAIFACLDCFHMRLSWRLWCPAAAGGRVLLSAGEQVRGRDRPGSAAATRSGQQGLPPPV